jgi:hypothetical protein
MFYFMDGAWYRQPAATSCAEERHGRKAAVALTSGLFASKSSSQHSFLAVPSTKTYQRLPAESMQ